MLVLSHPRSGSTEICRIIESCLKTPGTVSISLGEFFNVADRTSFGNAIDANNHFRSSTEPVTVNILILDIEKFLTKKLVRRWKNQVLPDHVLSEVYMTFNSSDEFKSWLYDERIRRLKLINSVTDFCTIKHFITLFDTPVGNELETKFNRELIVSQIEKDKFAFSYRKNLLETVFSGLIKTYYIDQPRANNPDNDFLSIVADGHNLHDMPVLEPKPIKIRGYPFTLDTISSYHEIDGIVLTNLMLFEFYHLVVSKLPVDNILCYEDIIETQKLTLTHGGKPQVYNIADLPPRIIYEFSGDGTVKKELQEKKMNYGDYAYEDYFTNSYVVHEVIETNINEIESRSPGFKDTLDKLGIIY